jgi:hypothetical protein
MLKKAAQPSHNALSLYLRGSWDDHQLRASNEGFLKPRVARARGSSQPPRLIFSILLNAIVVAISRTDKLFTLLLK